MKKILLKPLNYFIILIFVAVISAVAIILFISPANAVMPKPCYMQLPNGRVVETPCPKPPKCYKTGINPIEIPCIKPAS